MFRMSNIAQGCQRIPYRGHRCHSVVHIDIIAIRGCRVNATHLPEATNALC